MTNMLLKCISHFKYFSKIVLFSENKKIISFTIQQCTKPLIILTRTISQSTDVDRNIRCTKFDNLDYKNITKYEYKDIVNHIETQYDVNDNKVLSLIQWCNDITDCLPLERVQFLESLWLNLTICNFKFNIDHYNKLLKVYIDNNYDFSPTDLLTEMKDNKVIPNYYTYQMFIEYYCTKGNINEAMLYLKYDTSTVLYHSLHFFNALMIGYSQLGNVKSVENILNRILNQDIKPTTDTYAIIMCTYAKLNNIDKIKQIIQICQLHNMYFTNTHILRVIYTLAANNHIEHIVTMYQYLKKTLNISNEEMQVVFNLLNIGQVNTAITSLSHITVESGKYAQHKNIKIILKYAVDINMDPDKIIEICNYFKYNIEMYKKLLLISLYYSLLRDNRLSLAILRACKSHCEIKSHYFWPLLTRNALKCDFDGILNILDIMITEFNITPCIYTITDYILSMSFDNGTTYTKNLLMKCKVNETIINNAYVLLNLKKYSPLQAALYLQSHPDQYFYNILSHELRKASVFKNDVESFIMISCELLENTTNNCRHKQVHTSMDKQLNDAMIDFPSNKLWLKAVIEQLIARNIKLKPKTIETISNVLYGFIKEDLIYTLKNLSNKTPNMQIN